MAFGKGRAQEEPPVPAVEWQNVREFTLGGVERPVTPKRKRSVRGPRAIRVPKGGDNYRVFAPCAYCAPASVPAPPGVEGPRLYEDEAGQRLLCYLGAGAEEGQDLHHEVLDGQGTVIGSIRRIAPSSRMFKHTWRIEQPGHPEIIGRSQWASGDAKDMTERGATKIARGAWSVLADFGAEGGDRVDSHARTLEWRAGGQLVMTSRGKMFTVKADWLDRRLAFAFALIGDR